MAIQTTYPGVYIDEFTPGAPIEGVGTSTAAFIGIAEKGDLDTPRKVTTWDQFRNLFGTSPLPGFYLWYAVRAFFENGGQVCYIVRASNGAYATAVFDDEAGIDLLNVRARQPGDPPNPIRVEFQRNRLLKANDTKLYRPTGDLKTAASAGDRQLELKLDKGKQFRPGDHITIEGGNEVLTIDGVAGDVLSTVEPLQADYASNKEVRLASPLTGERTVRIQYSPGAIPAGALTRGTVLTLSQGAANTDTQIVDAVRTEVIDANLTTYRVTFRRGLRTSFDYTSATTVKVQSEDFDVLVTQNAVALATYSALSVDAAHPRYVIRAINDDPLGPVTVAWNDPPTTSDLPDSLPADKTLDLANGQAEDLTTLADQDFKDALDTLRRVDDVNFIAIPDARSKDVQDAMITHCQLMADRFAVLDARSSAQEAFGTDSAKAIEAQRVEVDSERGYAGLYYPWVKVAPAGSGDPIAVPPSGHVCGIIARTDATRGVHKAPANVILNGALGLSRPLSDVEHGQLNIQGINCIRVFIEGQRPILWGARTTATDTSWRYVNIRRLFLYLEESIQDGIRWAVFEPHNIALWKKLKRTISDFLRRSWRDGALFGEKPEDAYYVRIDEDLNPFSEQALGRLFIEIGVRPSYPAEFIIVRIGIWPGGSEVTES